MIPGWVRVCNDLKTNIVRGKLQMYAKGLLSLSDPSRTATKINFIVETS